jgi:hypothetical protein
VKRITISVKGLPEELLTIFSEANCNISSIINRAIVEAVKNPYFVHALVLEELSSKEKGDEIIKTIQDRMGAVPVKQNGKPNSRTGLSL